MLFITNRVPEQSHMSRVNRPISFDFRDTNPLASVFFCRRNGPNDYVEVTSQPFFQELRESPAKQILFYLHGFNNLPEASIFQKAQELQQLADDHENDLLQVVPLIWPCSDPASANLVDRYFDDRRAALGSAIAFSRVLGKFSGWVEACRADGETCTKRLNMLAHSMGNRVLQESLQVWASEELRRDPPQVFRNIFMPAADIVNEALQPSHRGSMIPMAGRNVVVYFADDDRALQASKVANANQRSRRLGHSGPYNMASVPANVFAKDCDSFNGVYDPSAGHTYFGRDENGQPGKLFDDMIRAVKTGRVPGYENNQRSFVF